MTVFCQPLPSKEEGSSRWHENMKLKKGLPDDTTNQAISKRARSDLDQGNDDIEYKLYDQVEALY